MSDNTRSPSNLLTAAAGEAPAAPAPTLTHYREVVSGLSALFDQFLAGIPFLVADTPEAKAFVRRKKSIREPFVTAAVGSLSLSSDLQEVKRLNGDATMNDNQFIEAFTPLRMKVAMGLRSLDLSIETAKARVKSSAQKIYAIARGLILDSGAGDLVQHVDQMRRSRKERRAKKAPDGIPPLAMGGAVTQT